MAIATLTSAETGAASLADINNNFVDLDTTKADLASPTFTGTPTLPTGTVAVTQSASDNSTKVATTAYVEAAVAGTKARVRAYKSGGNQQIDTAYEKVLFESESFDTGSNFASSTFTAPRTGYYLITANGDGDSNSSNGGRSTSIAIYKDGVIYSSTSTNRTDAAAALSGITITDVLYLTATQTIEIYAKSATESADFFSGEQYTFVTIMEM